MALYKYYYKGKYKDIIQDWGDLEYCEQLEFKIDKWLEQFNDEDKTIAIRLLQKFQMYRQKLLAEKIKELYELLLNRFEWSSNVKTFFMLADLKDKLSNSTQFACEFQKTTNININRNIISLNVDSIATLKNKIIFIDDYSGTGSTFIETIDLLVNTNSIFKNFEFVFLVVNISEVALLNINTFSKENNLNINVLYTETSFKAFKENHIFNTNEFKEFRKKYFNICQSLSIASNPFGFMETESLIAFDNCVPNNNLSLFREKSDLYLPLIYRQRPNDDELYKNSQIKAHDYILEHQFKSTKPIFGFKLMVFIMYCIIYGQRLNISKTCKLFGMTASQYFEKINFCRINNLIDIENEKYVLGRNFDNVFANNKKNKNLVKIVKNLIMSNFTIPEQTFCDIINYTPMDFEKRFQGYKKEE